MYVTSMCVCVYVLVCVDYFDSLWDNTFNSFIFTPSLTLPLYPSFKVGQNNKSFIL